MTPEERRTMRWAVLGAALVLAIPPVTVAAASLFGWGTR